MMCIVKREWDGSASVLDATESIYIAKCVSYAVAVKICDLLNSEKAKGEG